MDADEHWFELLEVRMAERLTTNGTEDFFSLLVTIVDSDVIAALKRALAVAGLTVQQLDDLCSQIIVDEQADRDVVGFVSEQTRKTVKRLYLAGLDPAYMNAVLGVDPHKVDACLREAHVGVQQREMLRLHGEGLSPTQIGRALGTHHFSVARFLRGQGLEPVSSRKAARTA